MTMTLSRSLVLRCSIAILSLSVTPILAAQAVMQLNVARGDSPSPLITLGGVYAAEVRALLGGELVPLVQASFWLQNDSDRVIVGIATTWVVTDKDGAIHRKRFTADSFLATNAQPVLGPHHRLLIAPRLWVQEEQLSEYAASTYFARFERARLVRILEEFSRSATVRVEVDSVIFADGEVVGANRTGLDSEIVARKTAAEAVLAALEKAGTDDGVRTGALSQIISTSIARSDMSAVWEHRFAQQLLHSSNVEGTIEYLRHLPDVPRFHTSADSIHRPY
jgi:hypothetical protein